MACNDTFSGPVRALVVAKLKHSGDSAKGAYLNDVYIKRGKGVTQMQSF